MSTDWTPPAEAVEAAARVFHDELFAKSGTDWTDFEHEARAALAAAHPTIVAEKEARYRALLERTDYLKAQTVRQASETATARAEVERLRDGIALAVDLLGAAHHGEAPLCDHLPWGRTGGLCACAHLRAALADHAEES